MLQQTPRYQKDSHVKSHEIGSEFQSVWKILNLIPKDAILDIGAAEGFLVYLARKAGFTKYLGLEIDEGRVLRGRKYLGVNLRANDIFEHMEILKDYKIFVLARILHNIGNEQSKILMDAINKKRDYLLIIKHKHGPRKETGAKREPLATRKGINNFLDNYPVRKKSFSGDVIVAGKGKYKNMPAMLRRSLPEP